jgi:hypothetical protein
MALRYCEQALAIIELFRSIGVLGKWPKTGLSEIDSEHPFIACLSRPEAKRFRVKLTNLNLC